MQFMSKKVLSQSSSPVKKMKSGEKSGRMGTQTPQLSPSKSYDFTNKDKEIVKNFLSRLELGDLCFSEMIEHGFVLVGETKAGKTTLAHELVHNQLVPTATKDLDAYTLNSTYKPKKLGEAVIGSGHESQTIIPNSCEVEDVKINNRNATLLDCPGYSDSKGPFLVVTNAYFHYRVFSKVKNIKFILTFDSNFMKDAFDRPIRTLHHFFNSFKDINKIRKQIVGSISFYFTKITSQKEESIVQILSIFKTQALAKHPKYFDTIELLFKSIIDDKKYFFFRQAKIGSKQVPTQNMLKKIHEKTQFWSRDLQQGEDVVDMSQIQFSVGKILQNFGNEDGSDKDFDLLCTESDKRFMDALGKGSANDTDNLQSLLSGFLSKTINAEESACQFLTEKMKKIIDEFYIYGNLLEESGPRKEFYKKKRDDMKLSILKHPSKIDEYKISWIQQLQLSKILMDFLKQNGELFTNDTEDKRSLSFYNKISSDLMKIISQFKKINYYPSRSKEATKFVNLIENFAYIIFRLLEQAKIFKIIFAYNEQTGKLHQNQYMIKYQDKTIIICGLIEVVSQGCYDLLKAEHLKSNEKTFFQHIKFKYITRFLTIQPNKTLDYYSQIQKYCKNVSLDVNDEKLNFIINKINEEKRASTAFNLKKSSLIATLIQNVRISKRQIFRSSQIKDVENYIEYMNQLGDQLTKEFFPSCQFDSSIEDSSPQLGKKYLEAALKIYKHVKNVYKTIQTYKVLKQKINQKDNPQELKDVVCDFAMYASEHGKSELALENLQHAYYLIDLIHRKKKLANQADYEAKRREREELSKKIGFTGIQQKYSSSAKYYDDILTQKYCTIIQDKDLRDIEINLDLDK